MAFDLAKPSTKTTGDLLSGALIGRTPSQTFVMRMRNTRMSFRTKVADAIGDGKTTPQVEHNGITTGRHIFQGWMLANQALGLASLNSETANTKTVMQVFFGQNESVTHKMVLEGIDINADKASVFVGVAMLVWLTDSVPAE